MITQISLVEKKGFKIDVKNQHQSITQTIGILTKVFCTSGANLVIVDWIEDEFLVRTSSEWDKFGILSLVSQN